MTRKELAEFKRLYDKLEKECAKIAYERVKDELPEGRELDCASIDEFTGSQIRFYVQCDEGGFQNEGLEGHEWIDFEELVED